MLREEIEAEHGGITWKMCIGENLQSNVLGKDHLQLQEYANKQALMSSKMKQGDVWLTDVLFKRNTSN
ncbi:hypothetical protein [Virgibacillus alimentarius]|uniref:Uncharacterized protein n=1 Tax=Virgibacillus alimentarius TaxID=698769 RepID=A0ABS4S9R2_9BACI|nr:hypothetical protein [Virgibacillus alimentarius]MBP2257614.1 hypothetical protein [Virgibacillus alimentarius]